MSICSLVFHYNVVLVFLFLWAFHYDCSYYQLNAVFCKAGWKSMSIQFVQAPSRGGSQ